MRLRGMLFLPLALIILPAAACAQQDAASAAAALQSGQYENAIRIATALVAADSNAVEARRVLVTALLETGDYEAATARAGSLHNLRGEALEARGLLEDAETAYRQAVAAGGPDRWTAEVNLAEVLYHRGERDAALSHFDDFITRYNQSTDLSAADLVAVGNAVWYIAATEPPLFQDAVMAFDEATKKDPSAIEAHIRIGELLVEKYNSTEAYTALNAALAINPNHARALLAVANAKQFDGDRAAALENVERALEVNPNLVPAKVLLARIKLDEENVRSAEEDLLAALEVNPRAIDALSMLASIEFLRGDQREFDRIAEQVRQLNPTYAGLLTTTAEIAAQQRRYGDAADLAARATALDPESWTAFGTLGLNLFRLGRIEEARAALETAFAGDPYNAWMKNNLDLLDTFSQYEIRTADRLQFMLHGEEADVLMPYLDEAAVSALTEMTQRYGERPWGTVRIEMYPRSADFSVRTIGLSGMGALGVSFGDVVALDSPSAREPGSYSWVTTLYHELAHTVALKVSNNRVPRWFTEGLSVVEERRAKPGWTIPVKPEFLIMYDDGELPPPSKLTEGFTRPKSPQHLGGAYDLASLVVQWIEETRGFDAILATLRGYRDGRSDEQIITSVLRTTPESFDAEFDRWLRARSNPALAREFVRLMILAGEQMDEGNTARAKTALQAAGQMFTVSGGGSPFTTLAEIYLTEGNKAAAIDALQRVSTADETAYEPNLELARLYEEQGDLRHAANALERAMWINPYMPAPHVKLAELYTELGDHAKAVRERRAVVGLRPTDRADAYYQLAHALQRVGDRAGARREVLRALEAAPSFERAQELLLQLHEGP